MKRVRETCVATHERERFECRSLKRVSMRVYIDFSLEVVA